MEGQTRELIRQKIVDSLAAPVPGFTRRDLRFPAIPGKAIAVIGMRRAGKTTLFVASVGGSAGARRGSGRITLLLATESERRRRVNPRKAYPVDPGLIPVFDRSGRANRGHALETVVLLELERRGAEIAYVRTAAGFEVDFLARYPEGGEALIQVCADLDDPMTWQRETRALLNAAQEYPQATLHLISLEPDQGAAELPPGINWRPATAWLLQDSPLESG